MSSKPVYATLSPGAKPAWKFCWDAAQYILKQTFTKEPTIAEYKSWTGPDKDAVEILAAATRDMTVSEMYIAVPRDE